MLNEKDEKIMALVRTSGPILPINVAKELGVETYLAGAMLSSLVKGNHIKISHRRVGSSPLYFMEGQETRVRERLFKELNELETKTLERLRTLKVAFEEELYPQERFLLKELKDFVTPLTVKSGDKDVSCWKHYSVNDTELNELIEKKLVPPKVEQPEPKIEPELPKVEEPKIEVKPEQLPLQMVEKPKPVKRVTREIKASAFESKVLDFFISHKIDVGERKPLKKGETTYAITEHSHFGTRQFLASINDKKALNEQDISRFYVECQNNKMPGMIFVSKEPSAKTKEYLSKHIGDLIKILVI